MGSAQGRRELLLYAQATWQSMLSLVEPATGLPADYIGGDLAPESRARYTSPTNVAIYLWAVLAARDLSLISPEEASGRSQRVLEALGKLERHRASGQFYNWYDPATLATLRAWPGRPRDRVYPFASSVDNGWLASALIMVANAIPALRGAAWSLATRMNFACYHDAHAAGPGKRPGLLRGGFWCAGEEPPGNEGLPRGDYASMCESVVYTGHHYGAFNTETRITSYIAIALGQVPREHYFAAWRTFPDTYDLSWQSSAPVGRWRNYLGVDVYEGAYVHRGRRLVPTWGGSMFEALMPALVVPEQRWGTRSWAVTHPLYVASQIDFGLEEAGYGYWGFSPASDPIGGYREYGVSALGMLPDGYHARGIVTPHAVFLALPFAGDAALDNLRALRHAFPAVYGPGGFRDAVDVASGRVAERYLVLDQGMILAAIANALLDNPLHGYLAATLESAIEPLMRMEEFGAG